MDEERPQLGWEEIRARPHPPLKAHLDSGELQLDDGLHPSSWIPRRAGPLMGGGSSTGGVWGWGGGLGGIAITTAAGAEFDGASLEVEVEEGKHGVPS